MFTGLIEAVGTVARFERTGAAARLALSTPLPAAEIALGDSIAINGVCLTVTSINGQLFSFDVSPETLAHTTFKTMTAGKRVNLERALRLSDRLGGHLVTGHVDCIATLAERREQDGNLMLMFRLPSEHARYLVAKGSVAIDGISLTVNNVGTDSFSVNVIPHTLSKTTLPERRSGDVTNIETDIIGKYLEKLVSGKKDGAEGGITLELLAKSGFL